MKISFFEDDLGPLHMGRIQHTHRASPFNMRLEFAKLLLHLRIP
jgi:hypothetical protein